MAIGIPRLNEGNIHPNDVLHCYEGVFKVEKLRYWHAFVRECGCKPVLFGVLFMKAVLSRYTSIEISRLN